MINLRSGDVNKLRQALASGQITEDQLLAMSFHGGGQPDPVQAAPQNALAQALSPQQAFAQGDTSGDLPMGSMRNEATGKITYFQPDPQAPRTNADPGFSSTPYPVSQSQSPRARLYGYGDGGLTDLGEDTSGAIPLDYSRGQIEVPGVGKAHYSRDGRFAVARGPNGEAVKVMLGYDAAASDRRNAVALDREKTMAEIARTNQGIEASKEQVEASKASRSQIDALAGAGISQKRLSEQFGRAPDGMRWKPDGTPEPTPGAPPKSYTELQGKSLMFGQRAARSSEILDSVGKQGEVQPGYFKRSLEAIPFVGGGLGTMANATQSDEQQRVEQAQRDFINATLRQESGAAIAQSEFDNAKVQYFPQPGDSKAVIDQKRANREMVIKGFAAVAGSGGEKVLEAGREAKAQLNSRPVPNASAVSAAKGNPELAAEFVRTFGSEAASKYGIR